MNLVRDLGLQLTAFFTSAAILYLFGGGQLGIQEGIPSGAYFWKYASPATP